MARHPYSIEINEPEEREERDPFDSSDEEMEQRREDEEEAKKREDLDKARSIVAKLIRKEFDSIVITPEIMDYLNDLVMVAKLIGEDELASEMSNDIKLY